MNIRDVEPPVEPPDASFEIRAHEVTRPVCFDRSDGFGVYFVQEGEDGPILIGLTNDIRERLCRLQIGNPRPLILRAWIQDADRRDERALHHRFRALHIRGEWFSPGDELLDYITPPESQ